LQQQQQQQLQSQLQTQLQPQLQTQLDTATDSNTVTVTPGDSVDSDVGPGRRKHEPRTAATSSSTTVESSGHDDGDEEHPLQPQRASALLQLRTTAMRVRHQLQALSFRRADGEHPPGEYDEKAGLHACSCTSPHFNDQPAAPAQAPQQPWAHAAARRH
jgi:hypothetical protein